MISSTRDRILAWLTPEHRLRCRQTLWDHVLDELAGRGHGERESGAFLLGRRWGERREILAAVFYDDIAPDALIDGMILFPGGAYGALWRLCRLRRMQVVADIHTHPTVARQSWTDRGHPMIAEVGHIALIAPRFGRRPFDDEELGVYEYLGRHEWRNRSGASAGRFFLRTRL